MGVTHTVDSETTDVAEYVKGLTDGYGAHTDYEHCLYSSLEPRAKLMLPAPAERVALVFGNETTGLSNEEVQRCHAAVTIPANPEFSSLNLGAAVQVLCYELRLGAYGGTPPSADPTTPFASPPATHDEVEGFYAHLERVMTDAGFYNPAQPGRLFPKLRRLFGRIRLEKDEINILRGILAATQEKTGFGRRD